MMHTLDGSGPEVLGIALNVACLSLGYALFINWLLFPVGVSLKKRLDGLEQDGPFSNSPPQLRRR